MTATDIKNDEWAIEMVARDGANKALAVAEARWWANSDGAEDVLAKMQASTAILLGRLCQTPEAMDFVRLHYDSDRFRCLETGRMLDEFGDVINENQTNQG